MNTMTRLWTVLILSILALTLNVVAVVEDLYVLPEDKAADTTLATVPAPTHNYCPAHKNTPRRGSTRCVVA